jgi:hypothetical protein
LGFLSIDFWIKIVFLSTGCSLVFIDNFGIDVFKTARCVNKKQKKKEKQMYTWDEMKRGKTGTLGAYYHLPVGTNQYSCFT